MISSVPMITLALSVIDRVIGGIQYSKRRYRTLFDDFLQPAFDELLLVHRDYIQMFQETLDLLPSYTSEAELVEYKSQLQKADEHLRKRRIEFEPVRQKLPALGKAMRREKLDPDVEDFIDALLAYFRIYLPVKGSAASAALSKIEDSINRQELDDEWDAIDSYVSDLIEEQREQFAKACEAFAVLKVRAAMSV